ncbi:hypothetical protein LguiA_025945 [Lonicera macranthoides]
MRIDGANQREAISQLMASRSGQTPVFKPLTPFLSEYKPSFSLIHAPSFSTIKERILKNLKSLSSSLFIDFHLRLRARSLEQNSGSSSVRERAVMAEESKTNTSTTEQSSSLKSSQTTLNQSQVDSSVGFYVETKIQLRGTHIVYD